MKKTLKRELTKTNDGNAPTSTRSPRATRAHETSHDEDELTTRMSSRERVHEEKLTGMRSRR